MTSENRVSLKFRVPPLRNHVRPLDLVSGCRKRPNMQVWSAIAPYVFTTVTTVTCWRVLKPLSCRVIHIYNSSQQIKESCKQELRNVTLCGLHYREGFGRFTVLQSSLSRFTNLSDYIPWVQDREPTCREIPILFLRRHHQDSGCLTTVCFQDPSS